MVTIFNTQSNVSLYLMGIPLFYSLILMNTLGDNFKLKFLLLYTINFVYLSILVLIIGYLNF
jgi:hypothetical protein